MVQSSYLREQAEPCHRLACGCTDPALHDSLLKPGEEFAARAEAQQNDETAIR